MLRTGRMGGSLGTVLTVLALVVPVVASAASIVPVLQPQPAASTVPVVKPAPAATGKLGLSLTGVFHVNSRPVTVAGRALRINGVMRPFIPGQIVVVHAFVGRRLIQSDRVRVSRSRGGTYGHFSVRMASSQAGPVFISAVHAANSALDRLVAYSGVAVLHPSAGFGSTGRFVQLIQGRLALLHFYIPQTGVYDSGTGLAIDAYHRLRGWGTSQYLDGATIAGLLDEVGHFPVHYPHDGKHAEGNLTIQLLALVHGAKVFQIYPISSGKPSTPTVLGHFRVYRKDPYYLPDGMYFSSFFYGGYAIHGYDPAPDYPASHGCMRVPIPDAVPIYNWLDYGNAVDVYN